MFTDTLHLAQATSIGIKGILADGTVMDTGMVVWHLESGLGHGRAFGWIYPCIHNGVLSRASGWRQHILEERIGVLHIHSFTVSLMHSFWTVDLVLWRLEMTHIYMITFIHFFASLCEHPFLTKFMIHELYFASRRLPWVCCSALRLLSNQPSPSFPPFSKHDSHAVIHH